MIKYLVLASWPSIGGLHIYDIDMKKIYSIDDKEINFVKVDGYALIGNPDHPYGT